MTVEPGELRAVIGPNGAGKTTFFNMISGFLTPSSGHIVFDGEDITSLLPARRVWRGIARTFQITEVFPELTVRENMRIAVESASGFRLRLWQSREDDGEVRARVIDLLKMSGLTEKADRLVGELAHGDQLATEIMMALALKPRLLLLDEPTARPAASPSTMKSTCSGPGFGQRGPPFCGGAAGKVGSAAILAECQ